MGSLFANPTLAEASRPECFLCGHPAFCDDYCARCHVVICTDCSQITPEPPHEEPSDHLLPEESWDVPEDDGFQQDDEDARAEYEAALELDCASIFIEEGW